ncbi:MAG: AmmeMemoRadiSam system protein B [Candidatus Marinimicrobia bacterium]|nr:AmmeMemoRadiSam system protein B [Candidatus Neomarinimicrobiota bacterium]
MNIRKPAVAGQFYPGERSNLVNMLDELFASVEMDSLPEDIHISGLIVPHAGYVFSGKQAAKAYQYIENRTYDVVCIISPSHREYFPAVSIYPGIAYKTPLGICPVDIKARELALGCNGLISGNEGHHGEHSLEVQLPFLQYLFGDIPILPLVMGDQSKDSIEETGGCVKKLYETYGRKILFVASSDLSHFHDSHRAELMDAKFISLLDKADIIGMLEKLDLNEVEACGAGPIIAILKGLSINKDEIKTLGYSHSGEVLHDNDSVVGYTSALIMKTFED